MSAEEVVGLVLALALAAEHLPDGRYALAFPERF